MRSLIAYLCALGMAVGGQEPPVLRVTTRLVVINVVVHGKKGEPVTGLTKDDFVLLDQDQPQKISFFSMETSGRSATPAKPLPANYFSNRLEGRSGTPTTATAVLFDGLNTRFEDQAYAKNELVKFLKQIRPEDRVALYALGANLRVLHDFTNDTESLLRALARHRGHIPTELAASEPAEPDTGNEELDAWLSEADQRIAEFYTINRTRQTLQALEAIAQHLARLPGRKNLIWISAGFPFSIGLDSFGDSLNTAREQRTFSPQLERAAQALNDASLAIYPVDARGLIGMPAFSATGRKAPARNAPALPMSIVRTHETMEVIAERTGGKAFYDVNDLKGAIREAIDDSRVTYVLAYYPAHNTWDGAFREVKVQVKRRGVDVRHRAGYFAFRERPETPKERDTALREAIWSPLEATGIGLMVRVAPGTPPTSSQWRVIAVVDPRHISLEHKDGLWLGTLDALFVQLGPDGRNLAGVTHTLSLRLARDAYQRTLKQGTILVKPLEMAPGASQLRVVVRDARSGNLGSVNIPLRQVAK